MVVMFCRHSSDKEDKLDLINPSTPTTNILPSASLGVAAANIDSCSESGSEIKLEKVSIQLKYRTSQKQ